MGRQQSPDLLDTSVGDVVDAVPVPPSSSTSYAFRGVDTHSRFDALSGQWVLFAPDRQNRPCDFVERPHELADASGCPFCAGNESTTPPSVFSIPAADIDLGIDGPLDSPVDGDVLDTDPTADWAVRVVPNKYPAVGRHQSSVQVRHLLPAADVSWPACGVSIAGGHEVIIESPRHIESITQLDSEHAGQIFLAFKQRFLAWRADPAIRYMLVFKNVGRQAGASLHHSHSQLIAFNQVPTETARTLRRKMTHYAKTGCCLQCDMIRSEMKSMERVIARTDHLVAYCPFASAFAMQVRITTTQHADRFENLSDALVMEVGRLTRRVTSWLERWRPGIAYNYLLHTRPPHWDGAEEAFHWALDIIPRTSFIAGLELGCGTMMNTMLPEEAASVYQRLAKRDSLRSV
ncbi:Galactose-1-phosphate uridylyltransferase [Crateriforma conspicua]|uniref:Galactose-1-phosphate uridylyltransferase n=1 Tax=Crateriforma conspicua TaxID=2527996 RepID=A0A5C6FLR4_9PLAN|nr:Galactose-1-phosphate uridylyltransferase [Crateriforma conspicua]